MSDTNNDEIFHLEELAARYQRHRRVLEKQCAEFSNYVPPHIILELEDVTRKLEQTLAALERLRPQQQNSAQYDRLRKGDSGSIAINKRSIIIRRLYKYSSFGVWGLIILGLYSLGVGWLISSWEWKAAIVSLLFLFLALFLLWHFSPVTNNSPKYQKYRKEYFRHLVYRHRDLDMKGLSTQAAYNLKQERVFVKLRLSSQAPNRISSGLIPSPNDSLPQGDIDIWECIRTRQAMDQNFAIIGAPGSGKTTLLKHITLTFASPAYSSQVHHMRRYTPILLFLRDHAEQIRRNPEISLPQLVHRSLIPWKLIPPSGWFETELHNRRCIVLLDGLDEVADLQLRKQVVAWVERQMQMYAHTCFLITSRPVGYRSNKLNGVNILEVRPFTSGEVKQFVEKWYHAIKIMRNAGKDDEGVRMNAEEGARDLLHRINGTPALTDLAANPLLLTMIATIHLYRSRLPRRRVELYAEICEVFLGKRLQALDLDLDIAPMQKQRVLEPLAYHMMHEERRDISVADALRYIKGPLASANIQMLGEDFLKMIEDSSGLLHERESGVYSFAHQTFQEFLAAVHIERHGLVEELITQIESSWWDETTLLYAARTDASDIVAACIKSEQPSIKILVLLIACLDEAGSIQPALRARAHKLLLQEVEDPDPDRRRIVAKALMMQRLRYMARLNERRYIDTALVTHAEYQLFLDDQLAQGRSYQPDHWQETHFAFGSGSKPVVGVRPSDAEAFCAWLTEWDRGGLYKLPFAEEGEIYASDDDGKLGYWVYQPRGFACEGITGIDITPIRMTLAYRIADDLINLQIYALINLITSMYQQTRDLASAQSRERDLSENHAQVQVIRDMLDLAHRLMQVLKETFDQATAQDLSNSLAKARVLARQSADDLLLALEAASASARAQGPEPARASAEDVDRARANARQSNQAKASAFAGATTLVDTISKLMSLLPMLKDALTDDFVQNPELLRYFEASSPHAHALLEALAYGSGSVRDNLSKQIRVHIFIPNVERFQVFAHEHTFVLDHTQAQECLRVFDRTLGKSTTYQRNMMLQRAFLRYWALMNSLMITPIPNVARQSGMRAVQGDQQRINVCYGLYLDFALLEERIMGHIPAVGGIRIVKELSGD